MQKKKPAKQLPRHIAIIMDGNGRWAKERGLSRLEGHQAGAETVRAITTACAEIGIDYLTLYAFSVENWKRPVREVNALMKFLKETLRKQTEDLDGNNVRLRIIGRTEDLPESVNEEIARAVGALKDNTGLTLVLALSYAGRVEILDAARKIVREALRGNLCEKDITDDLFRSYLYTGDIPDPDLLIRTSGELRISNFLLWQIAYSELWITETLWPAFRRKHLYQAVMEFQERERRFGRVSSRRKSRS